MNIPLSDAPNQPTQTRGQEILKKVVRPFVFDGEDLNRHELYTLIEALARSCEQPWSDQEISELMRYTGLTTIYIDGAGYLLVAYNGGTSLPGEAAAKIICQTKAPNNTYRTNYRSWGSMCSSEFEKNATLAGGLLVLKSPHQQDLIRLKEKLTLPEATA